MSRCRLGLLSASLAVASCFPGCAMMNGGKNWWTGKSSDERELSVDSVEDKWAFVGKEGRGGRTTEKSDWLDQILWSDKARDINRNLGYD